MVLPKHAGFDDSRREGPGREDGEASRSQSQDTQSCSDGAGYFAPSLRGRSKLETRRDWSPCVSDYEDTSRVLNGWTGHQGCRHGGRCKVF